MPTVFGGNMAFAEQEQLWDAVREQLRGAMTRDTYERVFGNSTVRDSGNGSLVVAVRDEVARAWATDRLASVVARSVQTAGGGNMDVGFVVGDVAARELRREGENTVDAGVPTVPPPVVTVEPMMTDFGGLDYKALFFLKSGYLAVSHYHTTFWQAYLALFNKQAFSVWQVLQRYDKRNIFRDNPVSWWTPSQKVSLSELAGTVGGARTTLTGRLVACMAYEQSKIDEQPLTECCGRHIPSTFSDGEPMERQCRHWRKGALEVLQDEGVLLVEESAGVRRGKGFRFQVWRMLPLLTPVQVDQLPMILRLRHEQWINKYGHIAGFDMQMWDAIEDDRLAAGMPGYAEGQQIENNFHPNPFNFP